MNVLNIQPTQMSTDNVLREVTDKFHITRETITRAEQDITDEIHHELQLIDEMLIKEDQI